jgi:carboxypeptidase Q
MLLRQPFIASLLLLLAFTSCTPARRQSPETAATDIGQIESASQAPIEVAAPAPTSEPAPTTTSTDPIVRIRDEGLNRSQVMQTLSYLTDVIGPRLTGSPNLRRANRWTAEKLTGWGLENAHEEAWGPFGRGWSLKRFSAQIVEPQSIPLIAFPKAWSPGFDQPLTAPVIHFDAKTEADFEKYRGKLKGAIVLTSPIRETAAHFEPLATRVSDTELLTLANADAGALPFPGTSRAQPSLDRKELLTPTTRSTTGPATTRTTTRAATGPAVPAPPGSPRALAFDRRLNEFLTKEGAALLVNVSFRGDGGTLFVASAAGPTPPPPQQRGTQPTTQPTTGQPTSQPATRPVWALDPPKILPQITLSAEHYNRLVRMIQQGERPRMTVDLQVQFHVADPMAYNTVAEIPGTDLKDQVVMLGAHLDSWHSATGATDNGAGVASVMEAVRILQAVKLKPRRTIRIALWTGEEQGLFGSKAYVAKHFGEFQPTTQPSTRLAGPRPTTGPASRPARKLLPGPEYGRLSAYFNLDNGTGKIRGVYLQGNESVRPIFRKWLAPFADLGAQTLTLSNTGGTDHIPFDAIGLPAFQFIQDPIEYWARTHHSNQDLYDRVQADDLKQASTILAAFIYNAAMQDEKLPRKPLRAGDQ